MYFEPQKNNLMEFSATLYRYFLNKEKPVFLCVGSDKFVADSLGPIVAEMLKKQYNIDTYVYGGIDYNVNANNLMQVVNYVETIHSQNPIVVIDATLGPNVGQVVINEGVFAGLGKCIPTCKIGQLSILGVVERKVAKFNLNSTRLHTVIKMAEFISLGCYIAFEKFNREQRMNKKVKTVLQI